MPPVEAPELIRPAFCWVPPFEQSGGSEAVDLASAAGLELDPWQAWAVEQVLGMDASGKLTAFEAALIVGRQNGKGTVLEALALNWLFLEEVDLVLWSAHEFKTAVEAFRRMRMLLQGAPDLWSLVDRVTTANGDEAIELTTGQRLKFVARSKASGRGFTGDKIILDEAYDLNADEMAALVPTLATRPDPQIIYTSSAGMSDSDVLRAIRDRGRKGDDPSLCWLEWCATPSGVDNHGKPVYDLDDRAQWRAANPGWGVRISEEFIEKERRALPPEGFARERLGVWDEPEDEQRPISLEDWHDRALTLLERPEGVPAFFVDYWPGLSGSISVAAEHDGIPHVELADYRPGAEWIVARVAELNERYGGARFAYLGSGAVSALVPAMETAGIDLVGLSNQDMGRACAHLQKLVADGAVTHSGDPLFSAALGVAVKRDIGDDLWTWSRRKSGDISPLVSATGAMWLLEREMTSLPRIF